MARFRATGADCELDTIIRCQALPFEERDRAPSFAFGRAIFRAPGRWNFLGLIFRLNTTLYAA